MTTTTSAISARVRTGITEFDAMLKGGFLQGDAVMLAGSAGSGKTTIALQYLVNGIAMGEPGIYLTFEQMPEQIYRDALSFGWISGSSRRKINFGWSARPPNCSWREQARRSFWGDR